MDGEIGYLLFGGEDGGGCVLPANNHTPVFGGFELLIASPAAVAAADKDCTSGQPALQRKVEQYVHRYITAEDKTTIEEITGHSFTDQLVQPLLNEDGCVLGNVLSNERFVPHPLNAAGLHLLRCVLAERMTDERRVSVRTRTRAVHVYNSPLPLKNNKSLHQSNNNLKLNRNEKKNPKQAKIHARLHACTKGGYTSHPDYEGWIRDGYLLKDYHALTADGDGQLRDILMMTVSVETNNPP